jgi:hypothetical protein
MAVIKIAPRIPVKSIVAIVSIVLTLTPAAERIAVPPPPTAKSPIDPTKHFFR